MEISVEGAPVYLFSPRGGESRNDRPALVFLHGAALDHTVWVQQALFLAGKGWRVLVPDLPGHGRSGGPLRETIPAMADWVAASLSAADVGQAILVGHSMGALIALDMAARFPDRVAGLVMMGVCFPMRVSPKLLALTRDDLPKALSLIDVWSHGPRARLGGTSAPGLWVRGADIRLMGAAAPGVLHNDMAACDAYDAGLTRAAEITQPTQLILGRRDMMTPPKAAESLINALPRPRVTVLPESGHMMMHENPAAVRSALWGFLREISS